MMVVRSALVLSAEWFGIACGGTNSNIYVNFKYNYLKFIAKAA